MSKGELAPGTLEGWYALHQMVSVDWSRLRELGAGAEQVAGEAADLMGELASPAGVGWSAVYQLVGGGADLMFLHFRETLDELGAAELRLRRSRPGGYLRTEYDFTSVTEAGLYHATADAASRAAPRSKEYYRLLEEEAAVELASPHVKTRLYPEIPADMRYVSFYPMTKRRTHPDNWYALPVAERNLLMREHGLTGRTYAGRVFQVITGSTGLDDWEWGVTLFAKDPLEFKRIVTEMRYDVASTRYGEFGEFFTGFRLDPTALSDLLRPA
ncbi:MAG TPA: hydrogen peroxide-dependent heme synthase [Longimicrobiales bacterium]|nr:hydrogen peroxide-dependent heme synthase [Longimicrobiales bacterium]